MVSPISKPLLTVLIDTYNHERFIEECLVSVIEQDFPASAMEILVVDDGSTDRTPEIVRRFAPRVRLLQKANGGQASAFNAGIPEARGEIVAFLDGDDWWARDKLARVVEAMTADQAVGIVGHGIIMVHRDGREQSEILREGFRFQANTPQGARLFRLRKSLLGTSRMTIRAGLLQRIGPVPETLTVQADEYLFTLAAVLTGCQVLQEPLTYYRYHDSNAFEIARFDRASISHKQKALAAVAETLAKALDRHGVNHEVIRLITEITRAEANQLRLMLDGGKSVETWRTERKIYDVHYPQAPFLHRIFQQLTLFPALFLPPRMYYGLRRRIVRSRFYTQARSRMLPNPRQYHVDHPWRSDSKIASSKSADVLSR